MNDDDIEDQSARIWAIADNRRAVLKDAEDVLLDTVADLMVTGDLSPGDAYLWTK